MMPLVKMRSLGRTGLAVSEIGFGGWGIGKGVWKGTDDEESKRALYTALDCGINYFDTAIGYGDGHSEKMIGCLARELGRDLIVSTKIPPKSRGGKIGAQRSLSQAYPPEWISSCVDASLRNLGMECLPIEKFHTCDDSWLDDPLWPRVLETLQGLKRAGKIRFIGASLKDGNSDAAVRLVESGLVDEVQVLFNIFDPEASENIFPVCRERGVAVVARSPLHEGGLSGELTPQTRFGKGDFRRDYFGDIGLLETYRRAERIKKDLASLKADNLAEAAIKFCLSFPDVSTVIPGMRKAEHVRRNAAVSGGDRYSRAELRLFAKHRWPRL